MRRFDRLEANWVRENEDDMDVCQDGKNPRRIDR
jgi:hypothetical protein